VETTSDPASRLPGNQTQSFEDVPVRVRYAETDQMGVVYYSNYLVYFEVGRAEYCRRKGIPYDEIEKRTGSYLIVAEAHCRYRRPLRYDQEVMVRTAVKELRKRTISFSYLVIDPSDGTVYAEGETLHVVTDRQGRPKTLPEEFRQYLTEQLTS
jgi:acyl-CoA thioester hydrolase